MKKLSSLTALVLVASSLALATGCSLRLDGEASAGADGDGVVRGEGQALAYFPPERPALPPVTSRCSPAPALFAQAAVCVCGDMSHAGKLTTVARPGDVADVAVLGRFSAASGTRIAGSLRVAEDVSFAGDLGVRDHLYSGASLSGAGDLAVGGDVAARDGVSGAGSLRVGGTLHGDEPRFAGESTVGGRARFFDPGVAPCGCDATSRFDVAGAVAAARDANDNASKGLPVDATALVGTSAVTLDEGRYYFRSASAIGKLAIAVRGSVQLYLDGDVTSVGEGQIRLAEGASLDVFVNGRLVTVGNARFGDPSRPEAFRLYVGGENGAISFAGRDAFYGLVYAPEAEVSFAGAARIDGAIVAKELSYAGDLVVNAARPRSQPASCEARGEVAATPSVVPAAR